MVYFKLFQRLYFWPLVESLNDTPITRIIPPLDQRSESFLVSKIEQGVYFSDQCSFQFSKIDLPTTTFKNLKYWFQLVMQPSK